MSCIYCEPESIVVTMCPNCKRRYNRLSLNRSKLLKIGCRSDHAVVLNKVLDDLAAYTDLRCRGCKIPPVVEAALQQFKDVKRPGSVCGYCGEEDRPGEPLEMHNGRMCEECYRFYNHFNSLYYGPKRPSAVKTRQTYRNMLIEVARRQKAGLKIPGIAATALKEDYRDSTVETKTGRISEAHPSIRRRDGI